MNRNRRRRVVRDERLLESRPTPGDCNGLEGIDDVDPYKDDGDGPGRPPEESPVEGEE